jgi:PGF-pre-PGF domain-containing protein
MRPENRSLGCGKRVLPTLASVLALIMLFSPAVTAIHARTVSLEPEESPVDTEVVYTVVVVNSGPDAIENVSISVPENFTSVVEIDTPPGWVWNFVDNVISYVGTGDNIPAGENRIFRFKTTTPGVAGTYTWSITTKDINDDLVSSLHSTTIELPPLPPPPAEILPGFTDNGYDKDNDNLYDSLIVIVTLDVSIPDTYRLFGSLQNTENVWIAWTEFEGFLEDGISSISLYFDGRRIYDSGESSPYFVEVWLEDEFGNFLDQSENLVTTPYSYDNFEIPPAMIATGHTDNIEDTDNNGLYDYLLVDVKIDVREKGVYFIHGSLFDVQGDNEIADAWAEGDFPAAGINTVQLKFRGSQIYQSGENGPYLVRLGLYDPTSDWWDDNENALLAAAAYNFDDFEPSPARLVPPHTDGGEDTDGDTYYDYLTVNVKIDVMEAGTYYVEGDLWDNDYIDHITWARAENTLGVGSGQVISLRFDGARIRRVKENGPYIARILLYDESWEWLGSNDHLTDNYKWENFQRPRAEFSSFADFGEDNDGDGDYDFLVDNVNIQVYKAGKYHVSGSLYKVENEEFPWMRKWIAHAWAENTLGVGIQTIQLRFPGHEIYVSKENGPYAIEVWMMDNEWNLIGENTHYTDNVYKYENFERPPAVLGAYTGDNVRDIDNDNEYDYLYVEFEVNVEKAGKYHLSGSLYDDGWCWLGWTENEVELGAGTENVGLSFQGYRIRQSMKNPYRVDIHLMDGEWRYLDSRNYNLVGTYSYENFEGAPIVYSPPHSDSGLDTNGDGFYDYLAISVKVDVSQAGRYRVSGSLYENGTWSWIDWAEAEADLGTGLQTIELRFKGTTIRQRGLDGPYRVELRLYGSEWEWFGENTHVTSAYTASQFQPPPVELSPPYSDRGVDTDDDGLYDYLEVTVKVDVKSAGTYIVGGALVKNYNFYSFSMEQQALPKGLNEVKLSFPTSRLYKSGENGPYDIYLAVLTETWEFLTYDKHETENYRCAQFEPPGAELFPPHSDYGLNLDPENDNLYDLLVVDVNVKVRNAGTYTIMGYLFGTGGMIDWRSEKKYLPAGENTVQLRFDGYGIVKHKAEGKLYVGLALLDEDGNWLDVSIKPHETAPYSYTQFEPTKTALFAVVADTPVPPTPKGETSSVNLENTELTTVTEIEITTRENLKDSELDVTERDELPPKATDPPGEELGFIEITVEGAENVRSAVIHFKVKKSWIEEKGLDKNTIKLLRFENITGTWRELETTFEWEDEEYYYLSAKTPGFSWFVVIGKVYQPLPEQPVEEIVVVERKAVFEFSVFEIPDMIKIGENVTITFTITNTGNIEGTYTIVLSLDNVVLETREVTLAAGENREVSFVVVPNATGTFYITIAGQTAELVVAPEIIVSQELISIEVPEIYVSRITIDAPAVFDIFETSITQIAVSVVREVENVILKIRQLKDKPEEISAPEGIVHAYLEILAEKLSNADISTATITFKVERSWIENQNIDETTITLYRYHAGEWQPLTTEKSWDDEEYIYFTAVTPGFSVFAIAGLEVEVPPTVAPTVPAVYPTVPAPVGPPLYLVIIAAIALVVVIITIIWRYVSIGARGLPKEWR